MYRPYSFIAFQLGWLSATLSVSHGWPMIGPAVIGVLLVAGSFLMVDPGRQIGLIAIIALLGTALDSLLSWSELVWYAHHDGPRWLCPLWITSLWLNFGMAVAGCLMPLGRNLVLAAVLGLVIGPVSYATLAFQGNLIVNWPVPQAILLLAALGAGWFTLSIWFATLAADRRDGTNH